MWQDLRYSARTLAQSPGFTTIAVLTLALGIGANTVIFSLVETLAFRRLPVADADRLVHVFQTREAREGRYPLSMPDYQYYREHARAFDDLAAHYSSSPINFVTAGESREINGSVVTANYFDLLQLHAAAGRFFLTEEDEVAGRNPVAVISYDWWRREFDGDPQIIGRSVQLNGTSFVVVGVAPKAFRGVFTGGLEVDVWMPSAMFRVGYRYCDAAQRDCRVVNLLGRLKVDRTVADAQNELSVLSSQLQTAYADSNKGLGVLVLPARGMNLDWRGEDARTPILLAAAVGFVLLIACANVAGLLLARGVKRRREIAIRLALGAGRWRLTRQLLTESAVLALIGGAAGLMVAVWTKDLLLSFYTVTSEGQRAYFRLDLDPAALAFTFGVSILSALAFGMFPALQASRPDVLPALKDEGLSGGPRSRARDAIVIAQVALSLVLLVGAGLLARSLAAVYRGPGFDPRPVALLRLRPSLVGQSAARAKAFQEEVIRRLEALPGVVAASPADMPPLPDWGWVRPAWLPGREPADRARALQVTGNIVGPHYFKTLGVPLLEGRDFESSDRPATPLVTIVDETLARQLWPDGGAAGRTLMLNGQAYQVVGVVRVNRYRHAGEPLRPFAYTNFWQTRSIDRAPVDSRTHVRVAGDVRAMLPLIRREIAAIDPTVPISEDRPLTEWLDYSFLAVRAAGVMLGCFSALALFLSAIGLYGVVAATVSQRTREIAIRMALGAERDDVARLVVGHGATLAAIGTAIGLPAAWASSRWIASLLYGVDAFDPATTAVTAVVLIGVALLASYLPARRALRVDPMTALRYE